jgi:hypothetical protein
MNHLHLKRTKASRENSGCEGLLRAVILYTITFTHKVLKTDVGNVVKNARQKSPTKLESILSSDMTDNEKAEVLNDLMVLVAKNKDVEIKEKEVEWHKERYDELLRQKDQETLYNIHSFKAVEGLILKAKGHLTDEQLKVVKVVINSSTWKDIITLG